MASSYVTKAGDALDLICLHEYGAQSGVTERVLEANPHIKDVAHLLPEGLEIMLPDIARQVSSSQSVKLWD